MKKKQIVSLALIMTVLCSNTCFAAGKTIEGIKNNTYTAPSDAAEMINGVKSQVPSYTSTFKSVNVTQSDFTRKTKAIKYWASHGNNAGRIWGTKSGVDFNVMNISNFKWSGSNLEFVFLAACNQLDGANRNPRAKYARAMTGSKAVRVICGYHEAAPGAGVNKDAKVVRNFIAKAKTGESVKSSWIQANQLYGNHDYCVLTHSGNAQYSRFEGFPGATYTRPGAGSTSILRFSSVNPGGTSQPYSLSYIDLSTIDQTETALEVPDYSIRATKADVAVAENVDTTVLQIDEFLTTQNDEVKDTPVSLTGEEAAAWAANWLDTSFTGIDSTAYAGSDLTVREIVAAEVDLDGNVENEQEHTVAYDVSYNYLFDGIPVEGDRYCAIVDDTGIISSGVNHNEYEVVPNMERAINTMTLKEASDIVLQNIPMVTLEENGSGVENVSVRFCDEDGDGVFDPTYVFELNDGTAARVNTITGEATLEDRTM